MNVHVHHESHWVEIRYWEQGDHFDWRVIKMLNVDGEMEEAKIHGTSPSELTAQTATEQAQMLKQASKVALLLDMAITCADDLKTIKVIKEDWPPALDEDGPHIAFTIKLTGNVLIVIPKDGKVTREPTQ